MLTRRSALFGLLAAPAIIRTPGLLMPVKRVFRHEYQESYLRFAEYDRPILNLDMYPIYVSLYTDNSRSLIPLDSIIFKFPAMGAPAKS